MHVHHLHIHALPPSHIVPLIHNTSISGHCDTRSRSTAPFVAPKLLAAQFTTPCHMCAATATGNAGSQDPSSRSTWSHRNVVHTPASVLCRCGDGQQARTRCAGGHTHRVNTHTVSSLSSTCHNDYTVAHGTACTLIVVTPHAPETCNVFNLGQVCRNTSGPVMPVPEGCLTQHARKL